MAKFSLQPASCLERSSFPLRIITCVASKFCSYIHIIIVHLYFSIIAYIIFLLRLAGQQRIHPSSLTIGEARSRMGSLQTLQTHCILSTIKHVRLIHPQHAEKTEQVVGRGVGRRQEETGSVHVCLQQPSVFELSIPFLKQHESEGYQHSHMDWFWRDGEMVLYICKGVGLTYEESLGLYLCSVADKIKHC